MIESEINPHDRGGPSITPRHENGFNHELPHPSVLSRGQPRGVAPTIGATRRGRPGVSKTGLLWQFFLFENRPSATGQSRRILPPNSGELKSLGSVAVSANANVSLIPGGQKPRKICHKILQILNI